MPERSMFFGATPLIFERARELRENMTLHEKLLWEKIKSNQVGGFRFKAQHPISSYIVDFYCHKLRLVIEIDGENHSAIGQEEYDSGRTYDLEQFGISVLRFSNDSIETNIDQVVDRIKAYCRAKCQ